ncbi:Bumetanide-sensitive sodium-(potassium)-chloride cotransporter [Blattella germanica]|nr:Bumetanide-sensitive sodium-(potassium)-chloride cotransporter [Blattella germanica]
MDSKHRFNVRRVSETNQAQSENVMQGVPENELLELEDSPGALPNSTTNAFPPPAAANVGEPKGRRRSSLAQLTRERLPRLDYYRNGLQALKRPSLGELHGEPSEGKVS